MFHSPLCSSTYFWGVVVCVFLSLICVSPLLAHTPHMACYDNNDQSISCFAEYSDGSSAARTPMRVVDNNNRIIVEGQMDALGEFTFEKPTAPFTVIFDGGPGHQFSEQSCSIR